MTPTFATSWSADDARTALLADIRAAVGPFLPIRGEDFGRGLSGADQQNDHTRATGAASSRRRVRQPTAAMMSMMTMPP